MTRTTQRAARAAVVLAVLGWAFRASATESTAAGTGQPSLMAPDARVRGSSQRLVSAISDAAAGSQTFRGLVDQIRRTDGIVYVMEGQCRHGVRACLLLSMTVMGANRVLWIRIDPRKVDRDLMGSVGHELQHALEVLSHSSIRSGSAMTFLYKKEASKEGSHFETDAAIKAGNAVRAELRERAAAGTTSAGADAAALTAGAILAGPRVSAHAEETVPSLATRSHVRSFSPTIASVIQQAGERTATFGLLVETIDASDSYVYVDDGECPHDDRVCLVNVAAAGPFRYMFVHVTRQVDWDLIGSIGQELRHAIKGIDKPSVASVRTMVSLYAWIGKKDSRYRDVYETNAAIAADNAVRDEVRAFIRRANAQTPVLLGFMESDIRVAVRRAVEGAAARLARPGCQDLFADFTDEGGQRLSTTLAASGKSPTETLSVLRFFDDGAAPQCRAGTTLAFTQTGSRLIRVCGPQFRDRFQQNRTTTEIVVIHEFLHSLGLGENPPSSQAITEQVVVRCGG